MESRVSCPFTAYKSVHTGMNTDGLAADVARYNETCHRESMHRPFSPATKNIRSRIDYLNNLSIFYVLLPCQPISSAIFHPIYVPEIDRIIFPLFFFFISRHVAQELIGKFPFNPLIENSNTLRLRPFWNLAICKENSKGFGTKILKLRNGSFRARIEKKRKKNYFSIRKYLCSFRLNSSKKGIV